MDQLIKENKELKERIAELEEFTERYVNLACKIGNLQYNVNDRDDSKQITDINDIKMEIYKLWYLMKNNKEYGGQ